MRTRLTPAFAALAAGLLVLGLAACGDDDDAADAADDDTTQLADASADGGAADEGVLPGDDAADAATTFVAEDNRYPTGVLTVAPGASITVDNQGANPHTMTADDDAFDSGRIDGGSQGSVTAPSAPGTYAFHCDVHPAAMTGTLTVEG